MNLILLHKEDFISQDTVELKSRRFMHVKEILRSKIGDELCVGLENKKIGTGRVVQLKNNSLELTVVLDQEPPKPLALTLSLALPRPIVFKRILAMITTLGIKKIILIHSRRVEKSYWSSPVLKEENIREQMIVGLEQAKDTIFPEIIFRKRFKPFVEDELPKISKNTLKLIAHPSETDNGVIDSKTVTVAIGPEGGFIPYEIEMFKAIGFQTISLGERILRVETAIPVVVGKLNK